jgi:hypothetical protein
LHLAAAVDTLTLEELAGGRVDRRNAVQLAPGRPGRTPAWSCVVAPVRVGSDDAPGVG